jgi:hypothetical protein
LRSLSLEATAAEDRPVVARYKWNRRLAATLAAGDRGHLALAAVDAIAPAVGTARGAALGFVEQALFEVETLLACGENEGR